MGVCNGRAFLDACGVCSGGTSSRAAGRFTRRPHGEQRPRLRGNLLRGAAQRLRRAANRGNGGAGLPAGGFGGSFDGEEVGVGVQPRGTRRGADECVADGAERGTGAVSESVRRERRGAGGVSEHGGKGELRDRNGGRGGDSDTSPRRKAVHRRSAGPDAASRELEDMANRCCSFRSQ